jgi:hypothetical protein
MAHRNRGVIAALLLVCSGAVGAQYVPPIELQVPAGFEVRRVAPGGGTTMTIDVVNRTALPRDVRLRALGAYSRGWDQYRFASGDACVVEQPVANQVAIVVGMLAPGEHRQCRFTVLRDASSNWDLIFRAFKWMRIARGGGHG